MAETDQPQLLRLRRGGRVLRPRSGCGFDWLILRGVEGPLMVRWSNQVFCASFENCGWGKEMRLLNRHPRMFLIGGPVRIPPGFPPKDGYVQSLVADPLKACGNDGLVGELGLGSKTAPFSFSVGERKIMNHSAVNPVLFGLIAVLPCHVNCTAESTNQ
jgi:hypothetical protein